MTTLSLTAGVPPRDRLEEIGLWSLVGIVAAMQLSIAAAQILLTHLHNRQIARLETQLGAAKN